MSKMISVNPSQKFSQFFEKKNESREISFLVLHHIEADSVKHAIEQLCEYQVSSHFLIDEQGKIFELVGENDIAWHAGTSYWRGIDGINPNSIGIEFINSSPFTKKFEISQMQAGATLCRYLIEKYQIKPPNIVGHSDIAYSKETGLLNRKQDPSHLFDWKFLAENGVGIFPEKAFEANKVLLRTSFQSRCAESEMADLRASHRSVFDIREERSAGNPTFTAGAGRDWKRVLSETKKMLKNFGYRVMSLNDEYDQEMQALALVFNRHFLNENSEIWSEKSQAALSLLVKNGFGNC